MKKLFLFLALTLSFMTFAQNSPEPKPQDPPPSRCFLLSYNVHPYQDANCVYQAPGDYLLELCPPFYNENLSADWDKKVRNYWCLNGKFPEGVKALSFFPYTPSVPFP